MRQLENLHEHLGLSRSDPDYNRIFMSYVVLSFSLFFFVTFIPVNIFLVANLDIALVLALLAPVCAGSIYYLFTTKDIDKVTPIATAILATFLFVLARFGAAHVSAFSLAAIFPAVAFFLMGLRRGALSLALFFPVFGLLFWWNVTVSVEPVSQIDVAINTILTLVIITLQLFCYELARKEASDEASEMLEYLEVLSSKDSLTGLWNRRLSDEFLEQEIARSQRQGNKFSVAIIDIDHFKQVNDTYGHAGGDTVLKELAHEFRSVVRAHDRVGRWGGEEFIVICSETGIEDAVALFNRMRAHIEGHAFSNGLKVTVSIGISEYRAFDRPASLVARADRALYRAKERGRNRVFIHEQSI